MCLPNQYMIIPSCNLKILACLQVFLIIIIFKISIDPFALKRIIPICMVWQILMLRPTKIILRCLPTFNIHNRKQIGERKLCIKTFVSSYVTFALMTSSSQKQTVSGNEELALQPTIPTGDSKWMSD